MRVHLLSDSYNHCTSQSACSRFLGGTPGDGVQNPLYLAAQHYRQSLATVRYPFGYNTQLKIVYFSNGR